MCHAHWATIEIYICNVSCRVQHWQKCKKHLNVISVAINKIIPLLFSRIRGTTLSGTCHMGVVIAGGKGEAHATPVDGKQP